MIRLLGGLLDRLLLLGGVLLCGLLPGYLQAYRQRLAGRLQQAELDLAPWQAIADRFHQGELDRLLQHHRASADATFQAEATALQQLIEQRAWLRVAVESLQGDLWQQLFGLLRHFDRSDAAATWALYSPSFPLDPEGLSIALGGGALIWLTAMVVISGLGRLLRPRQRSRHLQGPT